MVDAGVERVVGGHRLHTIRMPTRGPGNGPCRGLAPRARRAAACFLFLFSKLPFQVSMPRRDLRSSKRFQFLMVAEGSAWRQAATTRELFQVWEDSDGA